MSGSPWDPAYDPMPPKETDAPCSMRTGWTCWNDSAGHWHTFGKGRPPSTSDGMAGGPLAVTAVMPVGAPEPHDTDRCPEVEATGDVSPPSYDRRQGLRPMERKLVIALAEARLAMQQDPTGETRRFLDTAYALCDLFPVIACHACGTRFVQTDIRKTRWCSERCRYRIAQRVRRARLKAEAASTSVPTDPTGTKNPRKRA